jgi:hypothetical protein
MYHYTLTINPKHAILVTMKSHKHSRPPLTPIVPPRAVALAAGLTVALLSGGPATAQAQNQHNRSVVATQEAVKTPVDALTHVIEELKKGKSVDVTTDSLMLSGPIGVGKGRPIEFTNGDQTYFAFTQGAKPSFDISARQTAEDMAIMDLQVPGDSGSGPSVTQAHLNAHHVLVDASTHTPVGFTVGGAQS